MPRKSAKSTKELSRLTKVKKRDGRVVAFDKNRIRTAVYLAGQATGEVSEKKAGRVMQEVVKELEEIYDGHTVPTVEQIQDCVEQVLMRGELFTTAKEFILYRAEHKKQREQKKAMGLEDDAGLPLNSLKILESRYLLRDENRQVLETPKQLFERVAKAIARSERKWGDVKVEKKYRQEFYDLITTRKFLPNSPTLMNAGVAGGQLSACFVIPVPDSMEGIFDAVKAAALIHQTGGGTGFSFSRLRPKGDVVRSSGGVASGPVSFMRVFNMATEVIKQGGKRRGANMGILRVDHPDILDFITCKEDMVSITNFNISVAVTEKFMEAVKKHKDYDLINPSTGKVTGRLNARSVFDLLVYNAWKNGDPGIIFIDRINRDNPTAHIAEIESTNPCGEQPLMPYDSCNLGSINLAECATEVKRNGVVKYGVDWKELERVVRLATRFLDDVIEANKLPLKEITQTVRANRTVGLGVMGWADLLVMTRTPYNSEAGVKLARQVMKFVTETARDESVRLAKKRGSFPNFPGSRWEKEGFKQMRNRTVTTIAPTGTIGLIADCSQGIEPIFALAHVRKSNISGDNLSAELFYVYDKFEEEMKLRGLYSEELMAEVARSGSVQHIDGVPEEVKKIFVTAHDIAPEWHLKMQAAFQEYTDNAVSKTVNFSHQATVMEVEKVYMLAYEMGCKGVTIYRDGSRSLQVLNIDTEGKTAKETKKKAMASLPDVVGKVQLQLKKATTRLSKKEVCPECGGMMQNGEGCATCVECGYSRCSVSK